MLWEEIKISLHGGRAGSRRGLVGQSRELLIYTYRKIIHVRGIPLPIWLVRTRVGGVFMEVQSSQKNRAMGKQWCGLISIYANIWTSINGASDWTTHKRETLINCLLCEQTHQTLHHEEWFKKDYSLFNEMFKLKSLNFTNTFHDSFLQLPLLYFYFIHIFSVRNQSVPFTQITAPPSVQHATPSILRHASWRNLP